MIVPLATCSVLLTHRHIPDPGTQLFHCPEGCFWRWHPDHALNAPPYLPEQEVLGDLVHAPCPTTRAQALRYVALLDCLPGVGPTRHHWHGYMADDPRAVAHLSPADRAAWMLAVQGEAVGRYLDEVIVHCRRQAEANRSNPGYMRFRTSATSDPAVQAHEAAGLRASQEGVAHVNAALGLERRVRAARNDGDEAAGLECFKELHRLLGVLDAMVDDPVRAVPEAWHARGMVTRLLQRLPEAERCFLEAARGAPFVADPWMELTRVRSEQGRLELAEESARRAVAVDQGSARSWANLASVLHQRGRGAEALAAAERSLAIDPADPVARHVMQARRST